MSLEPKKIFETTMTESAGEGAPINEAELTVLAQQIRRYLQNNSILLLAGGVGAGKTTTVHALCAQYGLFDVQSPTYAIHQRHQNAQICIDHFDLYRLQNEEDLVSTGFWDLVQSQHSLIVIEWFERIVDFDWIESEAKKRKIFGLKIQSAQTFRKFEFSELVEAGDGR